MGMGRGDRFAGRQPIPPLNIRFIPNANRILSIFDLTYMLGKI